MLAVAWSAPDGLRPRPMVSFVFDGGVLADPRQIRLQEEELDAWRFTEPGEFEQYLPPFLISRVRAALPRGSPGSRPTSRPKRPFPEPWASPG